MATDDGNNCNDPIIRDSGPHASSKDSIPVVTPSPTTTKEALESESSHPISAIRMNGEIDGPGTETSDDIPAMLSDGEFVMTGRAVRGAGAFDMQNDGGIITLRPNGAEDRDKGTNLMYEMMSLFESQGAT
mgnify:CR=1 FL=1